MTPERKEEIRRTAYHEAGHAVVARALKKGVRRVFISRAKRAPPEAHGYCVYNKDFAMRMRMVCYGEDAIHPRKRMSYYKREAIIAFSGSAAVRLIGDLTKEDFYQDLDTTGAAIRALGLSGPSIQTFFDECVEKAAELVAAHAASVHAVADFLLKNGRMKGRDVDAIIKENTK